MNITENATAAHRIATTINANLGRGIAPMRGIKRAYVQECGNLRIVATSVAAARIAMGAAQKATRIADEMICHFEVRICKRTEILTFPATYMEAHAQGSCICGKIRASR